MLIALYVISIVSLKMQRTCLICTVGTQQNRQGKQHTIRIKLFAKFYIRRKNMKKFLALLLALVMTLAFVAACGDDSSDELTFALIPPAMISPYYAQIIGAAQERADELGIELIVLAPQSESDYLAQMQIVDDVITQGVDAIILCAINTDAIVASVRNANEADIPVVMFNIPAELEGGVDVASYVIYNQYEAAAIVASYISEQMNGEAVIAVVEGLPGLHTDERLGGFSNRVANYPGMSIVATQPGNWEREAGMNAATNMLQANPDINVIFGLSDEMTLGAYQAVVAAGLEDSVSVFGFDGTPPAIDSVIQGGIKSTISIGPIETGIQSVQVLYDLINGRSIPQFIEVETELITPQNAQSFVMS